MRTPLLYHPLNLLFAIYFLIAIPTFSQSKKPIEKLPEFSFYENTSLIFSVDPKSNEINAMFLKSENSENQLYELKADCYRCEYYLGTVEGEIKVKGKKVTKYKNSKFTINTHDNLMSGPKFYPGNQFQPGASYSLAGFNTTVVSNQNGKFVVESN